MTATRKDTAAAIAANRFGLGARPGELAVVARDPEDWLAKQLKGAPPVLAGEGLKPSSETLAKVIELRKEVAAERREKKKEGASDDEAQVAAALKLPAVYRPVYMDEAYARLSHSIATERPFLERLTQFWTNHFAVSVDKIVVLGLAGAMEREAIRPRVTGHFADLLLAVEKHPAMLLYLDNPARSARTPGRRDSSGGAAMDARRASTKTWRARSSNYTRSAWMAVIHKTMCQLSRRPFPAGRSVARTTAANSRDWASTTARRGNFTSVKSSTSPERSVC